MNVNYVDFLSIFRKNIFLNCAILSNFCIFGDFVMSVYESFAFLSILSISDNLCDLETVNYVDYSIFWSILSISVQTIFYYFVKSVDF